MKDRFSHHARQYATFRPRYPEALFDFIFGQVMTFDTAWDAGTGNGQAAEVLAIRFKQVYATDISPKQLEQAVIRPNITYEKAGERTTLPDHSVDLVTVAQAIHWFDRPKFYDEVKRVLRPGGLLAVWAYGLLRISPEVDPLIREFYSSVVGPYWDPERRLIDERLETIEFPFAEVKAPPFTMSFQWTFETLRGYLETWSATQKFVEVEKVNPVPALMQAIRERHPGEMMTVEFPLYVRMGKG